MKWLLYITCIVFFDKSCAISNCTAPSFNNVSVQSNFDLNKFLGIWYEIKWLPGEPHNESDIWRNFYQSFQLENLSTQRLLVPGKARIINETDCFSITTWSILANNSAKMILEKQDISSTDLLNRPYYILKTDYEHYALIYACTSTNYILTDPCEQRVAWLFSRTTSLSSTYLTELDQYIESNLCINTTELEITPQDGQSCYSSSNIHLIDLVLMFLFLLYI